MGLVTPGESMRLGPPVKLQSSDELRRGMSTVNFGAGQTRANNAQVRPGSTVGVSAFCSMA